MLKAEKAVDPFYEAPDPGQIMEYGRQKAENHDYWYRLYNDGRLEYLKDQKLRVEFYQYKDFVDGIKDKALNSLKLVVNRLLLDFEDSPEELGNSVENFDKEKQESKRSGIERLVKLLHDDVHESPLAEAAAFDADGDYGDEVSSEELKEDEVVPTGIIKGEKDFVDLHNQLYLMINEDPTLTKVFGNMSDEHVRDNFIQ